MDVDWRLVGLEVRKHGPATWMAGVLKMLQGDEEEYCTTLESPITTTREGTDQNSLN